MSKIIEICEHDSHKQEYISKYGWHFNKQLCDYAVSLMTKNGKQLDPLTKDYVDNLLKQCNITLTKNDGYDYLFVANMCKADYYGSSIVDEQHLALYIKDTIEDEDAASGTTLRRWCATMKANKNKINWEQFIENE